MNYRTFTNTVTNRFTNYEFRLELRIDFYEYSWSNGVTLYSLNAAFVGSQFG